MHLRKNARVDAAVTAVLMVKVVNSSTNAMSPTKSLTVIVNPQTCTKAKALVGGDKCV